MPTWRERAIDVGMGFFRASRAHRLAAPFTRGRGAILMFHRVRPSANEIYAPNLGLEIAPQFLDALLGHVRGRGYEVVSLDEGLARLGAAGSPPFVVLTFDDGYRDFAEHALPVLARHSAPFTLYVTAGFADGSARLWWVELEEAIRRLGRIEVTIAGRRMKMPTRTAEEKSAAFDAVYWAVRAGDETQLRDVSAALCAQAGLNPSEFAAQCCLDWRALAPIARDELATIGAHSLTHPRLARLDPDNARFEMAESRAVISRALGVEAKHFCYPVGDADSAGPREFALAVELGFASAVTTRPGVLFSEHRDHPHALPRLSVNGRQQSLEAFDILLSGAPFALINRGRRIAA